MALPTKPDELRRLREQAEEAYQEFLRRLAELEQERTRIYQATMGEIDAQQVQRARQALGV